MVEGEAETTRELRLVWLHECGTSMQLPGSLTHGLKSKNPKGEEKEARKYSFLFYRSMRIIAIPTMRRQRRDTSLTFLRSRCHQPSAILASMHSYVFVALVRQPTASPKVTLPTSSSYLTHSTYRTTVVFVIGQIASQITAASTGVPLLP